jgi:uncharacterized repeat protein (TIGR03943 family)
VNGLVSEHAVVGPRWSGMNIRTQGFVLLLFGGALVRLGISDALLRYVRPAARGWVLAAGGSLLLVAVLRLVQTRRDGVEHAPAERVGWLVLAPVIAILIIAPPALGSFTANRTPVAVVAAGQRDFPALTGAVPHQLALLDFTTRAVWDAGRTLAHQQVALTGFVLSSQPDGFMLARLVITCCAADARPVEVLIRSALRPAANSWVRVVGKYSGVHSALAALAILSANSVTGIGEPANPYD